MKLAALPKVVGLEELHKGWFHHFYNTSENQEYIDTFPPVEAYGVDSMNKEEWHSQQTETFYFEDELRL